jgi:dihydrodiol dehydrogenase / D-xylose 1-dehydrogenase (NADP)
VKELIELAESKKLFLMEAIWSRFFPSYKRIRDEIEKGTVGELLQVYVTFGVKISDVDRVKLKELGGGGVLDIGVYCVQLTSMVFKGEKPQKVIAGGHVNSHGVDESTSTTCVYSNGRTATLITHCRVELPNEAFIVGTKGTIKLSAPFWCSTQLTLPSGEVVNFPLPEGKQTNFGNSMGLHYQCNEVRRCIQAGQLESPTVSHKESILIAEMLESIRKQLGVVYPQDA